MNNDAPETIEESKSFKKELTELINKHSLENGSNTPDFILADFLCGCLEAFDTNVKLRTKWYGIVEPEPCCGNSTGQDQCDQCQETGLADPTNGG